MPLAHIDDHLPSEGDVERGQLKILQDRIRARMAVLGLSNPQLSHAIGRSGTYIWELLNGKIKNPSSEVIQSIAKELQCSIEHLYGEPETLYRSIPPLHNRIPVAGIAEDGAFRSMARDTARTIDHPHSRRYPDARHFALEVRSDSMNACRDGDKPTPIYEGMYVLCVDLASANVPIESGRLYAIERSMGGGTARETIIRRATVYRDRIEFSPESTNPLHEKFAVPTGPGTDTNVKVIGLVYSWRYDFQL